MVLKKGSEDGIETGEMEGKKGRTKNREGVDGIRN